MVDKYKSHNKYIGETWAIQGRTYDKTKQEKSEKTLRKIHVTSLGNRSFLKVLMHA